MSAAFRWLSVMAMAAVAGGCSRSSGPVCHPVRGQVLYQDRPLAEALVVFHPLSPPAADHPRPLAYTDAEGRFVLTTVQTRDGAPTGEYAICVEQRQPRLVGEETVRDGRNLLPARYCQPASSPLRYTVVAGQNEVPPLKITRQ